MNFKKRLRDEQANLLDDFGELEKLTKEIEEIRDRGVAEKLEKDLESDTSLRSRNAVMFKSYAKEMRDAGTWSVKRYDWAIVDCDYLLKRIHEAWMLTDEGKKMCEEWGRQQALKETTEFCIHCGAGIGELRRVGEGTCPECDPEGCK
jgi:hypothetical protein